MTKQIQALQKKQSLSMNANMQQSLSILQMSNTELSEFALEALDQNPFIEDDTITVESKNSTKSNDSDNDELINHNPSNTKTDDLPLNNEPISQNNNDIEPDSKHVISDEQYTYSNNQSYNNSGSYNSSQQDYLSNIASPKSLKEHLLEQINLSFSEHKDKLIACFLLDSLLSTGYLNINLHDASKILKCEEKIICNILQKLQTFDPIGIFARNLRECLLIQLCELEIEDPALITMVNNIDLIANGNIKKLSKICKVPIEDIGAMIKRIKALNPKPANGFFIEQTSYKVPDVILTFTKDNSVKIESNTRSIPKLRVNNEYFVKIKNNITDNQDKAFVKQECDSANSIVKSIKQRNETILKVATAIVAEQIEFFTKGVMYLKPMTLRKIAEITEFNESTISRSTANKYIDTPTGIFEIKYFFSSGLNSRLSDQNVSSTKTKEIIKQIILNETIDSILSDDDIATKLSQLNIKVARRTVAKYREILSIAPSSVRRKNQYLNK